MFVAHAMVLCVAGAASLAGCDLILQGDSPDIHPDWERLRIDSTSIEDGAIGVALDEPITLVFNQYLDPDLLSPLDAVAVASGGVIAPGSTVYSPTHQSLTYYPARDYLPELVYAVSLNPTVVSSVLGAEPPGQFELVFQTAEAGQVTGTSRVVESVSYRAEIAPLLEDGCGCHYANPGLLPLTRAALVDQPSPQDPERLLVLPFDPARSYLMHKVLPDYPLRELEVMPPPWAGDDALDIGELELLERWIATGADP